MRNRPDLTLLAFAPALLAIACTGSDQTEDCTGGKCDVLGATTLPTCKGTADFATTDGTLKCTPCGSVLADQSGRGFFPSFTANDALIKKVYMTFEDTNQNKKIDQSEITCPVDMPAIMAKLDKTDTKDCKGIGTRVVSETAARLGSDGADYRAVTSRDCENRGEFGLLFSSFGFSGDPGAKGSGVHITETGHPGGIEIAAFDEVDGVFNFYKEIDGTMQFFGSSLDFIVAGPGGPGLTNKRGCANCHPGGGLNMKELESPWTHWALEDNIPGADVLVKSRVAYMGTLQAGASMQFDVTQPGNEKWNVAKAKFLSTTTTADLKAARGKLKDDSMSSADKADLARRQLNKDLNATQAMLEPLFCTVQVNINNAGGGSAVPSQLFVSNRNGLQGAGKGFASADLTAALAAIGSQVPGVGGTELTTPFMVVEPSHEDESYLNQLFALGVLDQQLIEDVLMVDFTRPAMSDDRCGLLSLVPDLAPKDRTVSGIRDALIGALATAAPAAGSPAAQLQSHLTATKAGMPFSHQEVLFLYTEACQARDSKEVLRDGLKLRSLQKQLVFSGDGKLDDAKGVGLHPYLVFEFDQTMPADNVSVSTTATPDSVTKVSPDARFSPIDCTLVTKFVPVPKPIGVGVN
ncbi:MAG: hypothetical protein H6Q90_4946 [Deltaproteobacteria bacterium]|nr:hypothetical protein [Deltaproteobacteria bacterium]